MPLKLVCLPAFPVALKCWGWSPGPAPVPFLGELREGKEQGVLGASLPGSVLVSLTLSDYVDLKPGGSYDKSNPNPSRSPLAPGSWEGPTLCIRQYLLGCDVTTDHTDPQMHPFSNLGKENHRGLGSKIVTHSSTPQKHTRFSGRAAKHRQGWAPLFTNWLCNLRQLIYPPQVLVPLFVAIVST